MFSLKRRQTSSPASARHSRPALYGCAAGNARAAMGPNDKFDLVIKGGEVLDPSQNLRGKRDIGMRFGMIEAVEADIPVARANRVMNAAGPPGGAGPHRPALARLHHGHRHPARRAGAVPGHHHRGVRGRRGRERFRASCRRAMAAQSRTRLYAFVHIANIGLSAFPIGELFNIDFAQTEAAARTLAENADIAIGIKVRMSQNVIARHGLEPLRRAIRACEIAGTGGKVMCHIGGVETVELMSQILETLRPGDILTHCFSGAPNDAGQFTNIVQGGKLLPAAVAAKKRGVHVRRRPRRRQLRLHRRRGREQEGVPARHDVLRHPRVLRQLAWPALPHQRDGQVHGARPVARAGGDHGDRDARQDHQPPAQARHAAGRRAGRRDGARVVNGPVEFVDTRNNKRQGKVFLKPTNTVVAGVAFGQPYQSPFSVR